MTKISKPYQSHAKSFAIPIKIHVFSMGIDLFLYQLSIGFFLEMQHVLVRNVVSITPDRFQDLHRFRAIEKCVGCVSSHNHNKNVIILPRLFWTEAYHSCRNAIKTKTKKDGKELMKEILLKRFEKFPEYRKIVESLTNCTVIAEANDDLYWGTGLN